MLESESTRGHSELESGLEEVQSRASFASTAAQSLHYACDLRANSTAQRDSCSGQEAQAGHLSAADLLRSDDLTARTRDKRSACSSRADGAEEDQRAMGMVHSSRARACGDSAIAVSQARREQRLGGAHRRMVDHDALVASIREKRVRPHLSRCKS